MQKQYITETQVSDMTTIPVKTLRNDRLYKRRFHYIKIGRLVRYDQDAIVQFMESNKIKMAEE